MLSTRSLCSFLQGPKHQPPVKSVVHPLAEHQAPSIATGLVSSPRANYGNDLLCVEATVNNGSALVLLDCGATHSFVSSSWIKRHCIDVQSSHPLFVTMADGVRQSTRVAQTGPLQVTIGGFSFDHSFSVLDLEGYDVILGMPWFREHNQTIDFKSHRVSVDGSAFIARVASTSQQQQSATLNFISGKRASKEL